MFKNSIYWIMNMGTKERFALIIAIVFITDLVIFLNLPFLRQVLGFIFLTILPGLLILQILKLNKLEHTEKFVLSIGLSVSFLMFFGLLINNLSLGLAYKSPLSTILLLISFNIAFIVLAIIGHKVNKEPIFSLPNLNLSTSEKAFLFVPILFPALSIFGTNLMNTTDNNIVLLFLLFLIPIYVVFICFSNHKFPKRLYPAVIFLIGISLVLMFALRSNHIIGVDRHVAYYYFQTTLNNLHWSVWGNSPLDACLAISLLPTIYQSILNTNQEYLYKILIPLIYSISPLIIYIISKKYIGEAYAFLASFFFMSQVPFVSFPGGRTKLAIFFLALAMMMLFSDKIDPLKKRLLLIVFMASCMVSHYSTTYIFFFIMVGAFIGIEILSKKYTFKKIVSLTIVILFFSMIFFWYSQVTETAFNAGVGFIENTLINLNRFFIEESRTGQFEGLIGKELAHPILSRVNWVVTWCTFIFIAIGVLTMLKRYKEMTMISIDNIKLKKPDFLKTKFDVAYSVIALVCSGLLVMIVALPYVSIGYNIFRLYALTITILSTFFAIGGIILSKHFFFFEKRKPVLKEKKNCFFGKTFFSKERFDGKNALQNPVRKSVGREKGSQVWAYLVILMILIPYFLFQSGVIYTIFGSPTVITLNSEGRLYDRYYVHDQESCGAKWLKSNTDEKTKIYADFYGDRRLISQGKIAPSRINSRWLSNPVGINGYIYLRYMNVVNYELVAMGTEIYNTTAYQDLLVEKNRIYDTGGSEIYY